VQLACPTSAGTSQVEIGFPAMMDANREACFSKQVAFPAVVSSFEELERIDILQTRRITIRRVFVY